MIDVVFVIAFVVLPLTTFLVTRSFTWTSVGLALGFGIAGNAVQSLVSLGMTWDVRGLQWLVVGVMALVLLLGILRSRRAGLARTQHLRRQLLVILLPAAAIGVFLLTMRLMAPGAPGPLTAVGYLVNHPQAEDNAKWLHLAAQLADGRAIEFSGYAGGPLLLIMSMMAALVSVLSMILLGGVNQVAVAANTLVGTQFLLIALAPFALAPFAERRLSLRGGRLRWLPWPGVVLGAFVLFVASAVITSYGHLSLQFVLLVLTLWSVVFLTRVPGRARLMMTLVVVCTASVWVPFNVLGLALLLIAFVWSIRARNWFGFGLCIVTAAAVWDALISSTLFLLGINLGSSGTDSGADVAATTGVDAGVQDAVNAQLETAKSLFTAPGGVEQVEPLLAVLALASVIFCVWLIARNYSGTWRRFVPFAPLGVLSVYLLAINLGDAVTTGGAPHYGGHKLAFALTVMGVASTLPIAIAGIDRAAARMTAARWFAVGGVLMLLTLDTILPRALSALSPMLWPTVNSATPAYWSTAEVENTAIQPISSLPIACAFAPPTSLLPTALPEGQKAYNCTRLLLGLSGQEGKATVLVNWLQTDWMSNEPHWDDFHAALESGTASVQDRFVILMNKDGGVAGLSTIGDLLQRYPSALPAS